MPSASAMMREISDAGLRRVEVADRQPRDVRLDAPAHVGDRALRGDAEHLRERERGDRLDERRGAGRHRERHEQVRPPLADDVVDEELRGGGQDEAGEPVDEHQRQPERQAALARRRPATALRARRRRAELLLLRRFRRAAREASARRPRARSDLAMPRPPRSMVMRAAPASARSDRLSKVMLDCRTPVRARTSQSRARRRVVVGGGHGAIRSAFSSWTALPMTTGVPANSKHLQIVEIVADRHDFRGGQPLALRPLASADPFEQPAWITSTSEKSRCWYSVRATE